jgi:hypothetical protein
MKEWQQRCYSLDDCSIGFIIESIYTCPMKLTVPNKETSNNNTQSYDFGIILPTPTTIKEIIWMNYYDKENIQMKT